MVGFGIFYPLLRAASQYQSKQCFGNKDVNNQHLSKQTRVQHSNSRVSKFRLSGQQTFELTFLFEVLEKDNIVPRHTSAKWHLNKLERGSRIFSSNQTAYRSSTQNVFDFPKLL